MALVTAAEVKAWVVGDSTTTVTGVNDTVLGECISAAGELIIEETSRIWEKAAVTDVFDGDRVGESLILRRFPVTYPADAVTVTENGIALVVAQGYAPTANVIISEAGLERPAFLTRIDGPSRGAWAPGIQNITVGYQAGFATVPIRIKGVAKELAWLIYQQGRSVGVQTMAQAGASRSLLSKLSESSQAVLRDARRW